MAKETVHTPTNLHTGITSTKPSGHVTTDGKSTGILPARTTGSNSIEEVTYDHNAGLPEGTGKG